MSCSISILWSHLIDRKSNFRLYCMVCEMFPEMIAILLLFLKIVLSSAQDGDNASLTQLPDDKICLFTCSEWIFEEKIQQFAPSADLLGAGYLSKHKIGFSSDDPNSQSKNDAPMQYQKVWGAVYSINKNEYDAVLKQSQTEYSVPFTSNEDVFVVNYNEMNCVVVELGIQPGDHPPWRHFKTKIPNSIEDEAYYNRLAQIGVPPDFIKGLRNASKNPQYRSIIPQDYHPRQNSQQPKRTFDQLPSVQVHSNPNQQDNQSITGQIPETDNQKTPELSLSDAPTTTNQPNTRKLLPGVPTPNLSLPDASTKTNQPNTHKLLPGVPTPNLSLPDASTTNQPIRRKLLPGVPNPKTQPQVVTDNPEYDQGNTPVTCLQPGPHDVQVTIPKDIDSSSAPTPDQSVVFITPMKLPGSSTVKPVVAKPINTMQNQSPAVIPGKNDNSNVIIPSKGPILTTDQPKEINDTVPPKMNGVAQPITLNSVNPTVSQTPVTDQDYVVITPLKLPQNNAVLASTPVVGHDYKVQTPLTMQPDDTPQTLAPLTINNDLRKPETVPPMLLGGPKLQTQVGPVVTRQAPEQDSLLAPDVTSPPRLPTQAPDLLINPLLLQPTPESLPTSYNLPSDHDVPGSNSGLLTLSPSPDLTTTHPNDSPLLTLNDVPHTDTDQLTTPAVLDNKPVQQVNGPSVVSDQSPVKPSFVTYQINPNTVDADKNPDLLRPQTVPNNVSFYPDDSHTVHSIPATFGVSKPVPMLPKKPMFEFDQSHIPTAPSENQPILVTPQTTSNTIDLDQNPNLLRTVHPIPASFGVPKPAPVISDKPMFTIHQSNSPDSTQYQINPNTLDHIDNPNLLRTNTAPNYLQLHPKTDQTVHPIPSSFGVPKPAAVMPNKPMFGFEQSNPRSSSTIPATYGISSQPLVIQDKPMFSLDSSPLLQPKQIDGDNSKIPFTTKTPTDTVPQPQPDNVPLTTSNIPASTVQLTSKPSNTIGTTNMPQAPNSFVNNASPAILTSKPGTVPATTIPSSHTVQTPSQVVSNPNPAILTSKPGTVPAKTIPNSLIVPTPNQTASNANPAIFTSKPDTVPATTIPNSLIVPTPNQIVNTGSPPLLTSKPDNVPLTSTATPVVNNVGQVQTPKVSPQPVQQVPKPTYTQSTIMAPNYTPASPALGYSFAHRYPQYLQNNNYQPPNCFYTPDELIPGFTFASNIQLY